MKKQRIRGEKDSTRQISVGGKPPEFIGANAGEYREVEDTDLVENGQNWRILVAVSLVLNDDNHGKDLDGWCDEEHIDILSKVPGWLHTGRFITFSFLGGEQGIECLLLYEYGNKNGLDIENFKAATSTPWTKDVMTNLVQKTSLPALYGYGLRLGMEESRI